MRLRLLTLSLGTFFAATAGGSAAAQPALDDSAPASSSDPAGAPAEPAPAATAAAPANAVEYGVGIRLRNVRLPKGEIELFVERAGSSGVSSGGIGFDLTRRRGNVELQLGFEFEHFVLGEGVWIEKGKDVAAGDEADFIVHPDNAPNGEKLGWFTIEFTFLNHSQINKYLSVRYGAGAGLGIVTGNLWHYNIICNGATNANVSPGCVPPDSPFNGTGRYSEGTATLVKYDSIPPVFPVINAIIGLQAKPTPKSTVNLEAGIRTFLFFGLSGSYFF